MSIRDIEWVCVELSVGKKNAFELINQGNYLRNTEQMALLRIISQEITEFIGQACKSVTL